MTDHPRAESDAPEVRVPIQDEDRSTRRGAKPRGSVTWSEHVEAWNEYHRQHWGQDALTIAQRGGFGYWEITDLLGHEPETWRAGEVARPRVVPPADGTALPVAEEPQRFPWDEPITHDPDHQEPPC